MVTSSVAANEHEWQQNLSNIGTQSKDYMCGLGLLTGYKSNTHADKSGVSKLSLDKKKKKTVLQEIEDSVSRNELYSIDLALLTQFYEDKDILKLVLKHSIEITSENNNKVAMLISNLADSAKEIFKHHKNNNVEAMKKAVAEKQKIANAKALELNQIIEEMESQQGLKNNGAVAEALMKADILTPAGKPNWQATTVQRVRDRAKTALDI